MSLEAAETGMTHRTSPRVLVLRHGRSEANGRGLIASAAAHAGEAFGLTPEGRASVRRNVLRAQARGVLRAPLVLRCSPLLRARESAEIAGEVLGVEPAVDERLIERGFGDLELGSDELYAQVWKADLADPTHRRWGVESVTDVLRRAGSLVEELKSDGDVATVVLCTHGDVASTLLCAAQGLPLSRHRGVGSLRTGGLRMLPATDALGRALDALPPGFSP